MSYFLAKTEPEEYSIDDLERDGRAPWTGVKNPQARAFLKQMQTGDMVYIYHTGKVKAIVGLAVVSRPGEVPEFSFSKKFSPPLAGLSEIKANPDFSDIKLVRQSRLSIMDVPDKLQKWLLKKI